MRTGSKATWLLLLLALPLTAGCAGTPKDDPLEPINRPIYRFNDAFDRAILQPITDVYLNVPTPVRGGVTNFFSNATYPNVFVNDFLQAKFSKGGEDVARFVVNSTLGIGGVFDVAKGFGLAEHNEDLGQTLGVWGVGAGPYLVLPFLGPSTLRDVPDLAATQYTSGLSYISDSRITTPMTILNGINERANHNSDIQQREKIAVDPYSWTREAFLQHRLYLIYDGNPPIKDYLKGALGNGLGTDLGGSTNGK